MEKPSAPTIITAAELEALIQGLGELPDHLPDKFYPVRCGFVFLLAFSYCCLLLFWTEVAIQPMTSDPSELIRMGNFLYFRGWFVAFLIVLAGYSYLRNWFPALVFSAIFLVACVNNVFDMFNVYAEALSQPTKILTFMLLLRVIALWFLFLCVKNSSRLPDSVRDRLNLFLFLKRE
jgi:hypothetical protein